MKRAPLLALALLAGTAHAGGISRPNGISARGVGMGGAFTAWADDPSAVYFNPAGLDDAEQQVDIGAELVTGSRSYTPVADDGTKGATQKTTIASPVPSLGVVGRFSYEDEPSRVTLGAGLFNTFGGTLDWKKTGQPAFDSSEDVVLEAIAGASLHVSDRLAVGASLRIGLGLFSVDATMNPFDAHLSASGAGVGVALGALAKPTDNVRIALAWRSPMRVSTDGDGTVTFNTTPEAQQVSHDQVWPQSASLGAGWRAAPNVRLSAQVDWTQWSMVKDISVQFPANPAMSQVYREDWNDNWTVRAGGEYAWSSVAVRGGAYVDTNAVPDRTIERQYLDSLKYGIAAGASVHVAAWRIDSAVDFGLPATREVPNNNAASAAFPADRNKAPGEYKATLVTFELAVAHSF